MGGKYNLQFNRFSRIEILGTSLMQIVFHIERKERKRRRKDQVMIGHVSRLR